MQLELPLSYWHDRWRFRQFVQADFGSALRGAMVATENRLRWLLKAKRDMANEAKREEVF